MDFGKHWFQDKHMTCTTNSSVVILIVIFTLYTYALGVLNAKLREQVLLDVVFVFLL